MPKMKIVGLEGYINKIEELSGQAYEIVGHAIHDGAEVVADNTKQALENLEVDNRQFVEMRRSINQKQKNALIASFGIAEARYDGNFYNVKTGFDGYNEIITKRWPQGQPNVVIARSLESGTSFMKKNPIISKATRASKDAAIKAMQDRLTEDIEKIMKG